MTLKEHRLVIKKYYRFTYLFIIGILQFNIYSCSQYREFRYEYIDRSQISGMRNLYLLGVEIESTSTDSRENDVLFYSTLFVKDQFLDSFIKAFNSGTSAFKLSLMEKEKLIDLLDSLLKENIKIGFYSNNPLPLAVKGRWIKEMNSVLDGDGYVIIRMKTSVWEQNAKGFFKVYNNNGKVVWREQINDFSPYIVFDRESPYLMKNKQIESKPVENSYYEELKKIYKVLGSILAKEFLETL